MARDLASELEKAAAAAAPPAGSGTVAVSVADAAYAARLLRTTATAPKALRLEATRMADYADAFEKNQGDAGAASVTGVVRFLRDRADALKRLANSLE